MNKFRRARLERGLTQKELADKLGVSTVSVCKWESGKCFPKVKRIKEVANVLHTTVPELLNDAEGRHEHGKIAQCG